MSSWVAAPESALIDPVKIVSIPYQELYPSLYPSILNQKIMEHERKRISFIVLIFVI